jgi:transcriptional regulator with XRE-family HTH domain
MIIISEQEFNQIFSKQLKHQLQIHEMTQSDLAKRLGVSTQSVTNWCKGAKTPRMDKVDSMCKIFNCRRSDLMEEKSSISLNNNDKTILDKYHLLNDEGKQRLLERADELIELGYVAKGDVLKEA